MTQPEGLETIARSIIDSNRYMTLATADETGLPWVTPVWYAPAQYREFLWVSSPQARHSRNLATRPQLAIVIFDSHQPGGWHAVYMSAVAEELAGVDVDEGIARHRLYRATVSEHFVLDPQDQRLPVSLE
jgi:nitroimidazol reductase NimA-like FMN-containing flavoprotein (pyridoxamine 5'-phosphate oxidase superfamily)